MRARRIKLSGTAIVLSLLSVVVGGARARSTVVPQRSEKTAAAVRSPSMRPEPPESLTKGEPAEFVAQVPAQHTAKSRAFRGLIRANGAGHDTPVTQAESHTFTDDKTRDSVSSRQSWAIDLVHYGLFPSIAVEPGGNAHVLYGGVGVSSERGLRHAWYDGGTLQKETVTSYFQWESADLAVTNGGDARTTYIVDDRLVYGWRSDSTWFTETVTTALSLGTRTALVLDSGGGPHVCYSESDGVIYASRDAAGWNNEFVDSGQNPSLALDADDRPHIAYESGTALRHAWYDGSTWRHEIFDTANGHLPSLALDSDGNPHVSFVADGLKYAWQDGTAWHRSSVDLNSDVGLQTSLALDDVGYPHMAYSDTSPAGDTGRLRYAEFDGEQWNVVNVGMSGIPDHYGSVSLSLDSDGRPHLAYCSAQALPNLDSAGHESHSIRYARAHQGSWNTEVIGPQGEALNPSVAVDSDGNPHILYRWRPAYAYGKEFVHAWHDGTSWKMNDTDLDLWADEVGNLVLDGQDNPHSAGVRRQGSSIGYSWNDGYAGAWESEFVDHGALAPSLRVDSDNLPRMTYAGPSVDNLRFGWHNGTTWITDTVDGVDPDGDPSLALHADNVPAVVYRDEATGGVKYAEPDGSAWGIETVDYQGGFGPEVIVDLNGDSHVAYTQDYDLWYASRSDADWQVEAVDTTAYVGFWKSLVTDGSGHPCISYYDYHTALKCAWHDGNTWHVETVGPAGNDGTGLAFDGTGRVYIAYQEESNTAQDFDERLKLAWKEVPGYTISGQVLDEGGSPVSEVTVSSGPAATVKTDATGRYSLIGAPAGTHTVMPSKSGYTFSPASRAVTVPPDASGLYFIAEPLEGADLSISHLEVTQAVQDITNSVTLIAGKPTFVRVYVDCGGGCSSVDNVTGILRGYDSDGELNGSPLSPVNLSVTAYHPDNWTAQRGDLEKTLNYALPRAWATGTVTLTAEVAGSEHSQPFTFHEARHLNILYVPVRDNGNEPDTGRMANGGRLAGKLFPTAEVNYIPMPSWDWDRPLSCLAQWPADYVDEVQDCLGEDLISHLNDLYWDQPVGGYIFGWLPDDSRGAVGTDGLSDPGWNGGIGKAAFGVCHTEEEVGTGSRYHPQRIFAHEMGHLLGRRHTNAKDCTDVDPNTDWPYPDTAKIRNYGVDGLGFGWLASSPNAVRSPKNTYDYMSYCGRVISSTVWTSAWTHSHIYSQTLGIETLALSSRTLSSSQPYLRVRGLVFADDTADLATAWVFTPTLPPDNPQEGTQYCLEAQDVSATPLVTRCFDLDFHNYETGEPSAVDGFNLMLPYPTDLARIVLKSGGQELATRTLTANAPAVAVLSPNGGETWSATGMYTVTWSASDADGDPLTYRVLYSPDGSDWVPVGSAITETHLAVHASELPGGTDARVRVLASDGINTSTDESDAPFAVETKAPQAFILSPEEDGAITFGAPLSLQSYAYDLEDGTLDDGGLTWRSDRDGHLGTGPQVLVTLSSGQHTITLAATDSSSDTMTTTVQVSVNVPPALVPISGPMAGRVNTAHTFTATVDPIEATLPITYVWDATDQLSVTHSSDVSVTDSTRFSWTAPGTHAVTTTVSNAGGEVVSSHAITVCEATDVICDCVVDVADIQAVAARWRCKPGGCYEAKYDINDDDQIDVVDIMLVASRWGCGCGDDCYNGEPAEAAVLAGQASGESEPAVTIEPVSSTVASGQSFTVSVAISDVVNLGAFQFELRYNPSFVQAEAAALGPFLGSTGRNVSPVGTSIDNDVGTLSFGAFSFGDQPGPEGGGVLAQVVLTARGPGISALDLENAQILDPAARPLPATVSGGTVTVEGARRLYLPLVLRLE